MPPALQLHVQKVCQAGCIIEFTHIIFQRSGAFRESHVVIKTSKGGPSPSYGALVV